MEEREDNNNPIEELPDSIFWNKIKEAYIARGTVAFAFLQQNGVDVSKEKEFANLNSRQMKLEDIEIKDRSKLESIQAVVEKFASAVGVQFDPKTGEVYFGAKRDPNAKTPDVSSLDETRDELSKTSREYSEVTQNLYGEDLSDPNFDPEKSKNPGIVAVVNERKIDLMKRDVAVKKLLAARVNYDAAKDRMDMHAARHVAQKYRMLMMLEQVRLQLVREIALGAKENDITVQNLRYQINGLTNQIVSMEKQFAAERDSYAAAFGAAQNELNESVKSVEIEGRNSNGDKYSQSFDYGDDGVLNGSTKNTTKHLKQGDTYTLEEKEVFNEEGVMIYDMPDSKTITTINQDGIVVICYTEYDVNGNVKDSFSVGDQTMLEVDTNDSETTVEEKPDMEEEVDNAEVGQLNSTSVMQKVVVNAIKYTVNNIDIYNNMDIGNLSPEQRSAFKIALSVMGGSEAAIYGRVVGFMLEAPKHKDRDGKNPYEERTWGTQNNY